MPSRTTTGPPFARTSRRALPRSSAAGHTSGCPVSRTGTGANEMIERIQIVGARGRVGSAVSLRLAERGIVLDSPSPELVVLCVPDRAIAGVAAETPLGPWIAHVSG